MKATSHKNIPPKILKSNSDVCVEPLTQIFNDCVENLTFPDELKCADVTSLPKNGPTNTRTNFRPISVLPAVSKLFERIMDNHIVAYMTPFLSSLLCVFRKGYSAQYATSSPGPFVILGRRRKGPGIGRSPKQSDWLLLFT